MKLFKFLFSLLFLLNITNVTLALDVCAGQPSILSWSSLYSTSCIGTKTGDDNCTFDPNPNTASAKNVTLTSGACTATLSCTGAGGSRSETATLNVLNDGNVWQNGSCQPCPAGTVKSGASCIPLTGSITPITACIIPGGQNSCMNNLTWTSTNFTSPAVVNDATGEIISNQSSGSQSYNTPYGGVTIKLKNVIEVIDTEILGAVCASGNTWNGSTCGTPTGNISAAACTISLGAGSCVTGLTWTTSNLPSGVTSVTYPGSTLSFATTGTNVNNQITGINPVTYSLNHNSIILSQVTVSPVCISGSSWNGSYCQPNCAGNSGTGGYCPSSGSCVLNNNTSVYQCTGGVPGGSISAGACIITSGAGACNSNITWSTSNLVSGALTAVTYPTNQTLSNNVSGTNVTNGISGINSRTYYLYHNSVLLSQTSVTSACISGSTWNAASSYCQPNCAGNSGTGGYCPSSGSCVLNNNTSVYQCTGGTASGNVSATGCTISIGANRCTGSVTWSTSNLLSGALTAVTYPTNQTFSSSPSGTSVNSSHIGVGSRTYYLYHNSVLLSQANVTSSCISGSTWSNTTSSCVINACTNGANNPAACTQCPDGKGWNSTNSSCVICGGTGCTGLGGSQSNPNGSLVCNNGANNPQLCNIFPPCSNGNINPPVCNMSLNVSITNSNLNVTPNQAYTITFTTGSSNSNECRLLDSVNTVLQNYKISPRNFNITTPNGIGLYNYKVECRNPSYSGTVNSQINLNSACANGYTWNGSSCVINACANGAINPAACTQCNTNQAWYTSTASCAVCANGGCSGTGGNSASNGSLICTNGATNVPACSTLTAVAIINSITPTPTTQSPDKVTISGTCTNSTSYKIEQNSVIESTSPTNNSGTYNFSVDKVAVGVNSTSLTSNFVLTCIGSNTATANRSVDIPSRNRVNISALIIQPSEIICPGGSESATLKFALTNANGKICRITPSSINTSVVPTEVLNRAAQITELTTQLNINSSNYSRGTDTGKTLQQIMNLTPTGNNVNSGQIILKKTGLLTSGKRLFNYSTRFTMECDAPAAVQPYLSTNITYSKKTVDIYSTCIGQN